MDSQVTEAVYRDGVLRPLGDVALEEDELVRLTIERREPSREGRQLALNRLRAGIAKMRFFLDGPLPAREELHDRI
jgi:predicted DNA-binding antitoxin AbrB/MazE fold protein